MAVCSLINLHFLIFAAVALAEIVLLVGSQMLIRRIACRDNSGEPSQDQGSFWARGCRRRSGPQHAIKLARMTSQTDSMPFINLCRLGVGKSHCLRWNDRRYPSGLREEPT